MARDVAAEAPSAQTLVVDQVLAIPIADIEVRDRLRPIDPVWAQGLAALMAPAGYNETPINVCRASGATPYLLVAGGHRLKAARLNGWSHIRATVVSADALQRRLREVWENLGHGALGPLDRAAFVAEAIHLEKLRAGVDPDKDGRVASAQVRWQKALKTQAADANVMMTFAYGWSDKVAEQVGLSKRSIERDLLLHRRLLPDVAAKVRALPIAHNAGQLRALARMAEADQRGVVALLVEGKAKGATEALGILRQRPLADPEKKAWSAFFGGWSRLNARKRREALRELAEMGLPPGVRIEFDHHQEGE